jgi:hypothetical protein
MSRESKIEFKRKIRKDQKAQVKKEAARTVSALLLIARRYWISSPSRGYQMQLNIAIP